MPMYVNVSTALKIVHENMGITKKKDKNMQPEKHTSKSFDNELNEATTLFMQMGELAAEQVAHAVHSLIDTDEQMAEEVMAADQRVNQMERDIDELIQQIIIKRQPTANDLRLILAISKGVVDLERVGDEADKIARMAKELAEDGKLPGGQAEVQHLSNQVRLMVHEALDAFKTFDAEQALEVIHSDKTINREYQTATRALMTYIMEDSKHVTKVMNIMWVLRALERIGDHAKNIAELVIFTSSGMDVKHTALENIEKAVHEASQKAADYQDEALNDSDNNQDDE